MRLSEGASVFFKLSKVVIVVVAFPNSVTKSVKL